MPRSLFQDFVPGRRPARAWRAMPVSLALHAVALSAAAMLLVRPIVSAEEEPPPSGPLRFAVAAPKPVAASVRRPLPPRRNDAPALQPPAGPPPVALPFDPVPLEPVGDGGFDTAPAVCLTGCGDGAPGSDGHGLGPAVGSAGDPAGASGARPIPIGGNLRPPRKTLNVVPQYPDMARRIGLGGVVVLQCVIDAAGRVSEARVLRGHPLLDAAALDAVRQWRYEPTRLNGIAVPVEMTVSVSFVAAR